MYKFTGLFAALLLLGAAAFTLQSADNQPVKEGEGYEIGDTAADFSLMNVNGEMFTLSEIPEAKGYIVVFTCNHCPYAIKYEDRLIELHNNMADKGYPVIAINPNDPEVAPDDSFDQMKIRSEEKGFPFAYLFDEGQKVYPAFGATRTPHVFLLDAERRVRYIGAIDNNTDEDPELDTKNGGRTNYVENAIQAIEAGKNPEPSTTRAIGCTIKVKK